MARSFRFGFVLCICFFVLGLEHPAIVQDSRSDSLPADVGGADPREVVRQLFQRLRSGDIEPVRDWFAPELWVRVLGGLDGLQSEALALREPSRISTRRSNRDESETVYEVEIEHAFPSVPRDVPIAGVINSSYWLIGYNAARGVIDALSFRRNEPFGEGSSEYLVQDLKQESLARAVSIISKPPYPNQNSIKFLFATTRKRDGRSFGYDRDGLTFGAANVHIPDDHKMGHIELPGMKGWTPFKYQEKLDLVKHFAISQLGVMSASDWGDSIRNSKLHEALIFVHGFNTTFDESVYRTAQIMWDLRYQGVPILFTWPSWGGATNVATLARSYKHDHDSALTESDTFDGFIHTLHSLGIDKIHLLVHSMGNFLVLNSLRSERAANQPVKVGQWILAAPDIEVSQFQQFVPTVQPYVTHMTLYASAMDNALLASMAASGGFSRAGFVPAGKPLVMSGVDSIDVSALGGELFGLNHDVFASNRALIDDIGLVLEGRPPDKRLREIRPVPETPPPPEYWRFVP
jgi:esterase/lipase superfamily enzyme